MSGARWRRFTEDLNGDGIISSHELYPSRLLTCAGRRRPSFHADLYSLYPPYLCRPEAREQGAPLTFAGRRPVSSEVRLLFLPVPAGSL